MEQIFINSLISGSFYALFAMSFNLLLGTVKFFDVSFGARAVLGAYLVVLFAKILGWPLGISIFLGICGAIFLGIISEKFIFSRLREKKASNLVLLIASFGAFISVQAILAMSFSSQFQTISLDSLSGTLALGSGNITLLQIIFIVLVPIIFFFLWLFLKKTDTGRTIRAVGDNEEMSKVMGINSGRVILLVFIITSALASLGGIAGLLDIGIDPSSGLKIVLKTIVASIIGGVGSMAGGFLGGYILGGVENIAAWELGSEWQDAVAFLLLIIFLIFRPRGIMGKK